MGYGPEVWLSRLGSVPARPRRIAECVDRAFAQYGRQLLPSGTLHLLAYTSVGFQANPEATKRRECPSEKEVDKSQIH